MEEFYKMFILTASIVLGVLLPPILIILFFQVFGWIGERLAKWNDWCAYDNHALEAKTKIRNLEYEVKELKKKIPSNKNVFWLHPNA